MSPKSKTNTRKFPINTNLVVAASAIFISICALVVSVMQVQIERKQLESSVWPRLNLDISRSRGEPFTYKLVLNNNGVGPAIITQVDVRYKGKKFNFLFDAIYEMMPDSILNNPQIRNSKSGGFFQDDVMKAGDSQVLIILPNNKALVEWMCQNEDRIFKDPDLVFRMSYRNIYGDCWMLDKFKVVDLGTCD